MMEFFFNLKTRVRFNQPTKKEEFSIQLYFYMIFSIYLKGSKTMTYS